MKVLQVNSVYGVGSTGRMVANLGRVLRANGHECLAAYGRSALLDGTPTIRIGANNDVYWHALLSRITDRQGFYSKAATKKFIRQAEQFDPDVIHLHNLHGYYVNLDVLFDYLHSSGKPVVWTLHDCWPFTGHCTHFERVGCDKWKAQCYGCPQKREYPASLFLDRSRENYLRKKELFTSISNMKLISPSQWLATIIKHSFLGKYPVDVVKNGIDLGVFKPTSGYFRNKYHLGNNYIVLGVANVWNKKKGLDLFIQLAEKLPENFKVVLVGVTQKQQKGLPRNMIGILRTQNSAELAEIYSAADVFVNPTLEDNFPTTNLEALACGTPVVTYDTGGCGESVDEGCGIVVGKGNTDGLYQAVLKTKFNTRAFYADNCRLMAENQFNAEDRFGDYLGVYEIVCHKGARNGNT